MSRTARNHARAVDRLERAERELARALTKWAKLRLQVKRYERKLDWTLLAREVKP